MQKQAIEKFWLNIFYVFSAITLISIFATVYFDNPFLLVIAPALLLVYLSANDFRFVFFAMLFTLPLSMEMDLPGGFATDFPTEILIVGLMLVFIMYALSKPNLFENNFLKNPILFLLVIHYSWMIVSTFFSSDYFVSIKWMLAKTWYLTVFVLLTSVIITDLKQFKKALYCMLIPLLFTVAYTLIRHSRFGFSFESVNWQMEPFFRNHVNYACMLAEFVPFIILAITWQEKKSESRTIIIGALFLVLIAIYFSYTRSAWLSLLAAAGAIVIIRKRLMKWILPISTVALLGFFVYMGYNNQYLNHAPNFEQTIYHAELEDHLISTFYGEDVSSAERIYRWVAGIRMWMDKPWAGYGPGNFYSFYRPYTVSSFRTYVSENTERSSIHNYFLLMLTEQGIFGLIIFLILTFVIFTSGERIYHQTKSKEERRWVLAILLSIVIIYVNTFLSDLLETDKIGAIFLFNLALLINQDVRNRRSSKSENENVKAHFSFTAMDGSNTLRDQNKLK